ncbi:MAG: SDR family oxidoreductase [Desulfarculus sp.]|nr:SDR family oxidoreductase [Desulfarculus sp.]
MDMGLKGRVACVAGASQGLGRAVALGLAAEGCDLAVCARNEQKLAELAREAAERFGVRVWWRAVDLMDSGQAEEFTRQAGRELGRLDVLVTNGGGPPAGGFADFDEEAWLRATRLLLFSAQALVRGALPYMREKGWGRIVNVTSVSVKQPLPALIQSNSLRAAVIGWAKSLADEVGPAGITVNNICQGWILTERVDQILDYRSANEGRSRDQIAAGVLTAIPLGRMGRPEEFADLAVFLASERAAYITGASVVIDGGLYRGLM